MDSNDDVSAMNEFLVRDASCEGRKISYNSRGCDVVVQHVELHLKEFWMSTAR